MSGRTFWREESFVVKVIFRVVVRVYFFLLDVRLEIEGSCEQCAYLMLIAEKN